MSPNELADALEFPSQEGLSKEQLAEAVQEFLRSIEAAPTDEAQRFNSTVAAMHHLCACVEFSRGILNDQQIAAEIAPAKRLASLSPLVKRIQDWPRGYPGDFETIEIICEGRPALTKDHVAFWIEWYVLNSALTQQHRNKIEFIRTALFEGLPDEASILSVPCGGGRDFLGAEQRFPSSTFVLIDNDVDALTMACDRAATARLVMPVKKDVLRGLRSVRDMRFDRISFGGLFDYVGEILVVDCLSRARACLKPGGRVVFSNISSAWTFSTWAETFADWRLIQRTEEDLRRIVEKAGFALDQFDLQSDTSGLTWLAAINA